MSSPIRIGRYFSRIAVLGSTSVLLAGCVADFVAPLSVASHRYPTVGRAVARTPATPKVQVVDDEPVRADRLPTAREIFDLHPRGSDPEHMRQPFLLNPNEGPLKISTLSKEDAASADTIRLRQSETSARMATLRPASPSAVSTSPVVAVSPALGHQ